MRAAETNINDVEPHSRFVQEQYLDTLQLYLPEYTKEQLKVQLTKSGVLMIRGTQPLGDNKWSRFQKDFSVSANYDTNKITAEFKDGILIMSLPKLIVPAEKEEKTNPPQESPATKTNQEQAATSPDEPVQKKEAKSAEDEQKISGTKNDESEKTSSIHDDDQKARENMSGLIDAHQLANKGTNCCKVDDYKLEASESPASKLKMARQKMTNMALAVLFSFALGMCISNLQAWFSKKDDN